MGQGRTLTNKINQASAQIALRNAAKPERVVRYMHAGARMRLVSKSASERFVDEFVAARAKARFHPGLRAKVEMPNRVS